MRRRAVALAIALTAAAVPAAEGTSATAVRAASLTRCNGSMANSLEDRVREVERHPPAAGDAAAIARIQELQAILNELDEERGVLESVCTSDAQKMPLEAELSTAAAWALELQAAQLTKVAACPAAGKEFAKIALAQAWLDLANAKSAGASPSLMDSAVEKVEAHAQGIGFDLPSLSDASAYWNSRIHAEAHDAATKACPSPTASPAARLLRTIRK